MPEAIPDAIASTVEAAAASARRIGLIGCGHIGMPIVHAWRDGGLPGWAIAGVLSRSAHEIDGVPSTNDADAFFARPFDLIVETGGPRALAAHGARALGVADVWTVSAAALADPRLFDTLRSAGEASKHRLRVVPGAIAGLDGVAMAFVDPDAALHLDIDLLPTDGPPATLFEGSVREAARRYPDSVNVAAAAALAGPGFDATRIDVRQPGTARSHRLALTASSRYGTVRASVEPLRGPGVHPVAASLIALLRRELLTVWVG